MKPPCAQDRSGSDISTPYNLGSSRAENQSGVDRVHVSVPRAQDRNHIAGVTFHVFSGREDAPNTNMNGSGWPPRHGVARNWQHTATRKPWRRWPRHLPAARNAGRRPGKTTSPHISTRAPVSRGRKMRGGAPVHSRGHGFTTRNTSVRHSLGFGARRADKTTE